MIIIVKSINNKDMTRKYEVGLKQSQYEATGCYR